MSDLDPMATVLSVDGVGAFDLVSRTSMLRGLQGVEGGGSVLPFVRQFYGGPSSFLWDDACGNTHDIFQGEGGEQGDPLMPALYSLGQHRALEAVARRLHPTERLFAFLDDLYVVCRPDRVVDVHHILAVELWSHAKIQIQHGKTQVWNRGGVEPTEIETLQAAAQVSDPDALVWRGDPTLPEVEQGMKILGTPLGHPSYVQSFLRAKTDDHTLLLERIPEVPDLQSAWLILLFCASTRANYLLRALPPGVTEEFAASHDELSRTCLNNLLNRVLPDDRWDLASLPLNLGGLGLRNASRTRAAAHWASWADCLAMVKARHPTVATAIVNALDHNHPGLHFQGARAAKERLSEAQFDAPDWQALADNVQEGKSSLKMGQGSHGKVGSARQRVQWTRVSSKESCARGSWEHSKLSCVLKVVLLPVCPSPVFHLLLTRGLTRSRSAFSCCVVCGCNYPRPVVPAGVAVHSILVATTVQRAPWRGC